MALSAQVADQREARSAMSRAKALHVPVGFWDNPDLVPILRGQKLGELFWLLHSKAGGDNTQTAIGTAIDTPATRVNALIKERANYTTDSFDFLTRVADGLNMPDDAREVFGIARKGNRPVRPAAAVVEVVTSGPVVSLATELAGTDGEFDAVETIVQRTRMIEASNMDDVKLAYLERAPFDAILANERQPPRILAPRVRDLRRWVHDLLEGGQHPAQRQRLYVTGVYLSGILGALALDLGKWPTARAYGTEAFTLAEHIEDAELQAWARATQSLISYYAGDYHEALAYAQHGQRVGKGSAQGIRLALNGEARAYAKLGDLPGVERAVNHGFTLLEKFPDRQDVSPSLATDAYCYTRAAANAGTAYLVANRPDQALKFCGDALAEFDSAEMYGPQALTRLDMATANLMGSKPEPERAAELATEAIPHASDEEFESVIQRAQEFATKAKSFSSLPSVRDALDQIEAGSARSSSGQ